MSISEDRGKVIVRDCEDNDGADYFQFCHSDLGNVDCEEEEQFEIYWEASVQTPFGADEGMDLEFCWW
jgi:hypothetical protein